MGLLDRLGNPWKAKGRTILYGFGGVLLVGLLAVVLVKWNARKGDEAREALGRGIDISTATISTTPATGSSGITFPSEQDRAKSAIAEFEKVAAKYGDPYRSEARCNLSVLIYGVTDRQKVCLQLPQVESYLLPISHQ